MAHCTKKERKVKVKRSLDLSIWSVLSVRHRSVDFCVTQKRWIKMSNWGSTNYTKTCKPFVLNHMNQLNSSSLRAIHLEKEKKSLFSETTCWWLSYLLHWVGSSLWRVGEVWGVDSLSVEADDVSDDCRWTVLWKSLLLISTTREKRRSWKWLEEWNQHQWLVKEILLFIVLTVYLLDTHYSFVGVFASLALMMNRGKRMENKQPLHRKQR